MKTRISSRLTNLILVPLFSLLVGLVIAEFGLSVSKRFSKRIAYELTSPWERQRALIPDPVLGYRLVPYHPGIDERGYRNEEVLDRADILAIGDSMTYGNTVTADESWPSQLGRMLNRDVYNAGIGGYSACEYLGVYRELANLGARDIVVSIYLANDMGGAFKSVYLDDRCPELKTRSPEILRQIEETQRDSSLTQQALDLGMPELGARNARPATSPGLRGWLSRNSSLYALFRALYHRSTEFDYDWFMGGVTQRGRGDLDLLPGARWIFESDPQLSTVLPNPRLNVLAVDQSDVRIMEGRRVVEHALLEIRDRHSRSPERDLTVALIPSKDLAYFPLIERAGVDPGEDYLHLVEREAELKRDLSSFLRRESISHVDTTPFLRSLMLEGGRAYHRSMNDHPNAAGYRAIAEAIADRLGQDQ